MAKIYLSSTYADLSEHREAVYQALRRMGQEVVAMEDYVAADQRPLEKCLADVAGCDLYLGLFAWRYGYVPEQAENPAGRSITELEYRRAAKLGKPCLIFLLDEAAAWSPRWLDQVTGEGEQGQRIKALRAELAREKLVSFFTTPAELAGLVAPAVYRLKRRRGGRLPGMTRPGWRRPWPGWKRCRSTRFPRSARCRPVPGCRWG